MNSKFSTVVSLFLILVGIVLWSVSILTTEPTTNKTTVTDRVTTPLASSAREPNEQAAQEAARSIREATRLDLDIRLVAAASIQMAAQ